MPTSNARSTKLGLIVGNRGFFPDHLAASGREEMIRALKDANVEVIAPTPKGSNTDPTLIANESKFGAVETFEEAKGCAELFKRHRDTVGDGRFTEDSLQTFGGAGVVEIPRMQDLLRYICEQGFEHHTAANLAHTSSIVYEAATKYMVWAMYWSS